MLNFEKLFDGIILALTKNLDLLLFRLPQSLDLFVLFIQSRNSLMRRIKGARGHKEESCSSAGPTDQRVIKYLLCFVHCC
jgi:hypothetical protein